MLTHTIRAFSLVGLLLIAHLIKPFSLGNVAAFTRHTLHSLSFVLPQTAIDRLERAGELVALWGSPWGETGDVADKLAALRAGFSPADTNQMVSLNVRATGKRSNWAGKPAHRIEKIARSLQARNPTSNGAGSGAGSGATPLPIIPGIEASLIPSATLMAFPALSTAASDSAQDSEGLLPLQPKWFNLDCERRSSFEKQTWIPEEALLKLQEAQFPAPKVRVFTQRANNASACQQPGKAPGSNSGNNKQSC
jgi:hypothetical protein